jgi:hypothetical protein
MDDDLPPQYRKEWNIIEVDWADDKDCRFAGIRVMILRANINDWQMSLNNKSQKNKQCHNEWQLLIERLKKRSVNMSSSQKSNLQTRTVAWNTLMIEPWMTNLIQTHSRLCKKTSASNLQKRPKAKCT